MRLALSAIGFRRLMLIFDRSKRTLREATPNDVAALHEVQHAIARSSRVIPGASCLTQALAARVVISRLGIGSNLRIGVGKDEAGKFIAHAWLDCGAMIVVGGADSPGKYSVLPSIETTKFERNLRIN